MTSRIFQWIGVKPEDRRKLIVMAPVFFLCGISEMLNYNGYMTLFNQRFGSQYLPYVYAAEAVILPVEAWFMSWLTGRLSKPQLMRTLYGIMGGIIAANAVVLLTLKAAGADFRWYYPILFLTSSFVVRQQTILLWSLAVDLCPTQQAKRVMPVFVSAAALGGIVAGLIAQAVSKRLSADAVYMLAPLLLLAGAFNYWKAIARYLVPLTLKQERSAAEEAQGGPSSGEYFRRSFTSPYLLVAIGIMTFMPALYFLMEYEFLNISRSIYSSEKDFASFFGRVTTLLFTAALLLQLVSTRITSWLGQSNMLTAIAVVFTGGFLLVAATLGTSALLFTLSLGYMFLYLLLYYFAEPANQMFFKLLPIARRDGYRYVAQGVSASAGILIGALLQYLHTGFGVSLIALAWIGTGGAVLLVLLAWIGRRLYIRELIRSVQTMTDVGHDIAAAFEDFMRQGGSPAMLSELLDHRNDYAREVALGMIGRMADDSFLGKLLSLADDRSARIRIASLRAMNLERAELQELVKVASFLEDPDFEVRAEGVRLLGRATHMPHQAVYFVRLKLLDPHPKVVSEAVKALYSLQNETSFEACYEVVQRFLKDGGEPTVYICRTIAELEMYSFLPDVEPLLGEVNPAVRAEAIACMGKLRHVKTIPWLLEQLEWAEPALHETTVDAFVHMGEGAVEPLLAALDTAQAKVWNAAVRALTRLLDEPACSVLVDASIRKLEELWRDRELEAALRRAELPERAELAAMRLEELKAFILEAVWCVMERLGDAEVIQAVRRATEDADEEVRESGIEALAEGTGDKRLSAALLNLLSGWADPVAELSAGDAQEAFRRLAGERDSWLQLLASDAVQMKERADMSEERTLMGMLDKVVFLKQVPFFSDLSLEELGNIAGIAIEETHPEGSRLIAAGGINARLGVIVEGCVQLLAERNSSPPESSRVPGEKEVSVIAELSARDVFGETSALDGTQATATALTVGGEVRMLALSGEEMAKLIRLHPEIGMGLLRASLARVRMLEQTIAGINRPGGVFGSAISVSR